MTLLARSLALLLLSLLLANTASADETYSFDLPAQPLAATLNSLASTSGTKLIYADEAVRDLQAAPLKGNFTLAQALDQVLNKNRLGYELVDNSMIVIKQKTADPQRFPEITVTSPMAGNSPYNTSYTRPNATTATKTDTPIMETPVSIQVIPQAVMNDQQVISVADALRNVSGVQPGNNVFYDNFIIRGFDANFSTYRNGLRQTSVSNLEVANLEQIEVLKGPAAVLFGRIEPGGMVNLVPKRPLYIPYYSVQQQFGSYNLYRTTVDATGPINSEKSLLYRMNIAYKDNNTFRDFVHQEHVFVAPTLTWKPTSQFETNLDVEYQYDKFVEDSSDSGIPAIGNRPAKIPISRYFGDAVFNRNHRNTQERVMVGLDWTYQFNEDWKLKNRFLFMDTQYHQSILWSDGLQADNETLSRGLWHTPLHRTTYGTNLDLIGRFETGIAQHQVLVGFDLYRKDQKDGGGFSGYDPLVKDINIYNPVYGINLDPLLDIQNFFWKSPENWYGVYFQDQITLWDKLHILGGGRYDWAKSSTGFSETSHSDINLETTRSGFFSPRVGILYQPWQWLSLYGNYVESIGSNNGGRSISGQPFAPQTATQYEGGIKMEFFNGRLNSTLAYFDLTKQNMLTTNPDNPLFSIAVGEARSDGVELDIAGSLTENISLIATYAYTNTKITKDSGVVYDLDGNPIGMNSGNQGNQLASVPRNSGSIWIKYDSNSGPLQGLNIGTGVFVRGQREGDVANTFELPSYTRWDASVGYRLRLGRTRITPQLNVYNLLDETYYDTSANRANIRPGIPLTFLGSVKMEY